MVKYVQDGEPFGDPNDSFTFSLRDGGEDTSVPFDGTFNITIQLVATPTTFALKTSSYDGGADSTTDSGTDLGHLYYDTIDPAHPFQFGAMESTAHHWYLEDY